MKNRIGTHHPPHRDLELKAGRRYRGRRGIALLLVMISLIVCTILTAGFLSSQGTGIGIARNERDAEKARGIAQSGIDLCYWLIRNRSDWRSAMSTGAWMTNYTIGEGTVSITAASGDGTSSFINDTTKSVILTSVGTYGSRTFTLTATVGPTGGGTVFRGGNYTIGKIIMGVSDSTGGSTIDSYNSAVGTYAVSQGSNAIFGNSVNTASGLTVYGFADYSGSFVASSNANLANAVYSTHWFNAPSSVSLASQPYTLGSVVVPNTAGLTSRGPMTKSGSTGNFQPGAYDSVTLTQTTLPGIAHIQGSGIYHIGGNVTISGNSQLIVDTGVNAVFVVDGNLSLSGSSTITLTGSATLSMYVSGSVTIPNSALVNSGGNTSNFTLLGTSTNSSIVMKNSAGLTGSVYAPSASVSMQNSSAIYGAIIGKDLTMTESSAIHFDENLKNKRIDNITGGSAPAGTADFNVKIVGSSSVVPH